MYGSYNEVYKEYFENYELNDGVYTWNLTKNQERCLKMAIYMVDNKCSVRQVSKEFGLCKTQVHWWIHNKLSRLSIELYDCCKKQMKLNKQKYFR